MVTDREAHIIWVNGAFSKSLGYGQEELIGKTPRLFKSGKHGEEYYRKFWDTLLGGTTWHGEFLNRRRDGSLCLQTQATTPLRQGNDGAITHFISLYEEMSGAEKREEKEREAPGMDEVGQLAAGIAHHFNNLLAVIQCNSELLLSRDGALEPESRELADRTLAASRRAAELVRQLVGFSRSRALELHRTDLNRVVEAALAVNHPAGEGKIKWETHFGTGLPAVLLDTEVVFQVVSNILTNAFDAMPSGGRLTTSTGRIILEESDMARHPAGRPGEFVCLSIRDTGCGIPTALLSHIFDPFFSTKEGGGHSGLGLAFVCGVVKQHGGWTEASSIVGRGTTLDIFLPASTNLGDGPEFPQERPVDQPNNFWYPPGSIH